MAHRVQQGHVPYWSAERRWTVAGLAGFRHLAQIVLVGRIDLAGDQKPPGQRQGSDIHLVAIEAELQRDLDPVAALAHGHLGGDVSPLAHQNGISSSSSGVGCGACRVWAGSGAGVRGSIPDSRETGCCTTCCCTGWGAACCANLSCPWLIGQSRVPKLMER